MKILSEVDFINRSKVNHKNKYDYSKIQYINSKIKVNIICPLHGEFWQRPENHMRGEGCRKCGYKMVRSKRLSSIENFIQKAIKVHEYRYNYSKTFYDGSKNKIEIICPEHGSFWQIPNNHLRGATCPECSKIIIANKNRKTTGEFIQDAVKIHGKKYDYSNVEYKHKDDNIVIICQKHGRFLQSPHNHLCGAGCPKCISSKGEQKIMMSLNNKRINYECQKKFLKCRSVKNRMLRFDFYLPEKNVLIEYDGPQHYGQLRIGKYTLNSEEYKILKTHDQIKNEYAKNNGIRLLRIPYWEKDINGLLTKEL
jgi:very-short-patch-repair endonuclease